MKAATLVYIFCVCLNITLIHGDFDGQVSCAFGKSSRSKRSIPQWFAKSSVSKKHVKFLMYRKVHNDNNFAPMKLTEGEKFLLERSEFDPSKLTKIFIHGYKSNHNKTSSHLIREGFFKNGDFNVIIVDWSEAQDTAFGTLWTYDVVVKKLNAVAKHVSNMLLFLERNGLDLSTTTVVGHSLGAHVAGIAGHHLGGRIGRIVGLDPAGPLISERTLAERLSKDDAVQVEVIHSEIDQCGLKNQMGHYDFYPNGGRVQPGCSGRNKCSHSRSYEFFAESLDPNTKGFYARLCNDWWDMQQGKCYGEEVLMGGLNTKTTTQGIYYVKTNDYPPYAQGRS